MDLFLPKTADGNKRVARVSFRSYYLPKQVNFQHSGFYYIGKNAGHIEKLVSMYKNGYALESLDKLKAALLRSLEKEVNNLPEIIVCETTVDFAAIRSFSNFLREHPILCSIPLILDGSGLTENQLDICRRSTRPDEILFLDSCNEKELKVKIQFLRKMKSKGHTQSAPRIEENFSPNESRGHFFKRAFDILVSSIALLLLSPLFLLIAIAVRLESRGPIFYIAKRAGRGYKIFNFYKFRTMIHGADKRISELAHLNQYNAESAGPVFFKISNDPRITRIGNFLRNTSLDELPQLLNVFLGDMSLVGNRPLPLYEAAMLTTDDYAARFLAPAGITGLWQIKKRGNKDMSVEERINMDIDYASKCSFATDFWIIASTPSALLQKDNV
jgi:lipopolysaccharide/colanic/teichoic acid biosynthesis glycosyltransferase